MGNKKNNRSETNYIVGNWYWFWSGDEGDYLSLGKLIKYDEDWEWKFRYEDPGGHYHDAEFCEKFEYDFPKFLKLRNNEIRRT